MFTFSTAKSREVVRGSDISGDKDKDLDQIGAREKNVNTFVHTPITSTLAVLPKGEPTKNGGSQNPKES